jgi:chitinase
MGVIAALVLTLLASLSAASPEVDSNPQKHPFRVVGYLPEWRLGGANWREILQRTDVLVLFSLEVGKAAKSRTSSGSKTPAWSKMWSFGGLDRLPSESALEELKVARGAAFASNGHSSRILLCFGGNGRSHGFFEMASKGKSRSLFVSAAVALVLELGLDGVDINWEYPGFAFGRGYHKNPGAVRQEFAALADLLKDLRDAFDVVADDRSQSRDSFLVTAAYYPDGRQEDLLASTGAAEAADMLHMMTYDQHGQHSTTDFAQRAIETGVRTLPAHKLTLGVPFYGRHEKTGEWTSFEDLVQRHHPLDPSLDDIASESISFNGRNTIAAKTRSAMENGLGGVMIWEVGQDCRLSPVERDGQVHVKTCPDGEASSLLCAIDEEITRSTRESERAQDGVVPGEEAPLFETCEE